MHALIVANGSSADLPSQERVPEVDLVVAADGGVANARRLGRRPSVVIGDMDSLDATDRAELEAVGVRSVTHPVRKDATDLELAMRYTVDQGATEITIVGVVGGRLDQTLANLHLLILPFLSDVSISLLGSGWQAFCVRRAIEFTGWPSDVVSLLPLTPQATGVTTDGLYWELNDDVLRFGSTLGISNEMTDNTARVSIDGGILLLVHNESS